MKFLPIVTIGMPVYNCEGTVAESIASILNQTFQDWELIICDDGSQDRTLDVVRGFSDPRIRIRKGSVNLGLPARLNQIIAACNSEFFARMDGDDIAYPKRIERQLKVLEENPGLDLLGGSILIFNEAREAIGFRQGVTTHREICGRPWRFSNLVHVTWTGRTAWFRKHRYNEWASHAQDRDLLFRSRHESTFAAMQEALAGVREDRPVWRKLLPARKQLIRTTFCEGLRQRDLEFMLLGPAAELLKCALDAAATSTGFGHHLLRHRIPPVSRDQIDEWKLVLEETRATVMAQCTLSQLTSA